MAQGRVVFTDEMPSDELTVVVHETFEAFDAERQRLEAAIAEAQARIDAARAGRASLPGFAQLLDGAHHALARMEAVYGAATDRLLREADADARAAIRSAVQA